LIFKDYETYEEARNDTLQWLSPHKEHIQNNKWEGLPELTNSHGKECLHSCTTQAWSMSTVIDSLRDLD
jgi:glycogen debranching enzyme